MQWTAVTYNQKPGESSAHNTKHGIMFVVVEREKTVDDKQLMLLHVRFSNLLFPDIRARNVEANSDGSKKFTFSRYKRLALSITTQ
jgi:hypothetical protein